MLSFFKQRTTITGIATILGTVSTYLQGQVNIHDAISAILFALVLIIFPEEKQVTAAEIGQIVTAAGAFASAVEPPKAAK